MNKPVLHKVIFYLFLIHWPKGTTAVIFDGPCPHFDNFPVLEGEGHSFIPGWGVHCGDILNFGYENPMNSYRVYAHLPVDDLTWNIFHNPFDNIECLEVQMNCPELWQNFAVITNICHPYISTNGSLIDFEDDVVKCKPTTYDLGYKPGRQQVTRFGVGIDIFCPNELAQFATYTFHIDEQIALVGCRNLTDDSHDEGAWILVPASNVSDVEVERLNGIIDEVLDLMPPLSATRSNFVTADLTQERFCECQHCDYNVVCPSSQHRVKNGHDYYDYVDYYHEDYWYYDYYYDENGDGDNGGASDIQDTLSTEAQDTTDTETLIEATTSGIQDSGRSISGEFSTNFSFSETSDAEIVETTAQEDTTVSLQGSSMTEIEEEFQFSSTTSG